MKLLAASMASLCAQSEPQLSECVLPLLERSHPSLSGGLFDHLLASACESTAQPALQECAAAGIEIALRSWADDALTQKTSVVVDTLLVLARSTKRGVQHALATAVQAARARGEKVRGPRLTVVTPGCPRFRGPP